MAQKIKTLFANNNNNGARSYAAAPQGWSQIMLGHLSRTVSYQGRRDLHRALNY